MTIVEDDEMGGDARTEGHRIAVYHIVQYQNSGYSVEEIAEEFDLIVEDVAEAIEWAENHREEIPDGN